MSSASGLDFSDDSVESSSQDMDSVDYQPESATSIASPLNLEATAFIINLKPSEKEHMRRASTTVVSQSDSLPLRAPGFAFSLTLNLKNSQKASESPTVSVQDSAFDDDFEGSSLSNKNTSQLNFNENSSEYSSDGRQPAYDMEEIEEGNQSMAEEFEPMMVSFEREETRGDTFINCRNCENTFDYSRYSLWVPGYRRTLPQSLRLTNEYTHPQIVRCPGCDAENCMACEKSPHDERCSYAHARVMWHALCTVDDAIVQHRNHLRWERNTKSLNAAVAKALNTLIEHMPKDTKVIFGYCDLLRKSLLLDQVAVIIGETTVNNQFDTIRLQCWAFIYMISQRSDLYGLLFEDRLQDLRILSPGVRVFGFPVSFYSVKRTYDADRYSCLTYRIWSLIKHSRQCANEYLSADAQRDDSWPAVIMARSIVNLHDDLQRNYSSPPELITLMHVQKLSSFAARLDEMHLVEDTRYGAVLGNTRLTPSLSPFKKRGLDKVDYENSKEENIGGKRKKVT